MLTHNWFEILSPSCSSLGVVFFLKKVRYLIKKEHVQSMMIGCIHWDLIKTLSGILTQSKGKKVSRTKQIKKNYPQREGPQLHQEVL